MASPLAADGNFRHAPRLEHGRESLLQVALQDDRIALDDAATAERLLELAAPGLELARRQRELLDHGDFLAAALLALEANDRARRAAGRLGLLGRGPGRQLIAKLRELGEWGLLPGHGGSLHSAR